MGTFTLTLREALYHTQDIGLNEYPLFDESYRIPLNKKITAHFMNREIGQETIDLFIFAMARKMNEIMPLYNKLYESEALAINPLLTFKATTSTTTESNSTGTNEGSSTASNESGSNSTSKAFNSDYPQTRIIDGEEYASSGADSTADSTATGTATTGDTGSNTASQDGSTLTTSEGFQGSMSSLLMEYRLTFLNIDMQVIGELESLFMLLWDNGDGFTASPTNFPFAYFGRL